MPQRYLVDVKIGPVEGQVGIILTYEDGVTDSFLFTPDFTRQLYMSLQEAVLMIESPGFRDHIGIQEDVQIRLSDPEEPG